MHWVDLHERHSPLFTIEDRFPKLDVAGSIPVSRSMFSMTYKPRPNRPTSINLVCETLPKIPRKA
jgi:hypothetical protein